MNWQIFSLIGYISVGLWLCMPLLWLLHWMIRPRRWLIHVALIFGVSAFVLAKLNSMNHVNRIQVDRSEQIKQQMARQEAARKMAEAQRSEDVANIRFAEDSRGDFLDTAGMDEADLKYFDSIGKQKAVDQQDAGAADWKKQKQKRNTDVVDDSLEAQIGALDEEESAATKVSEPVEEEKPAFEPILMSDQDKVMADRLDATNLKCIRWLIMLGIVLLIIDYLKRANHYRDAYFPLPLPSEWIEPFSRRAPVTVRAVPRRSVLGELDFFARRNEPFLLMTDDHGMASDAAERTFARLPFGIGRFKALVASEQSSRMDDAFMFEMLWYGRGSLIVDSPDKAQKMLQRFMALLKERRQTRARAKQTVHLLWDLDDPLSDELRHQFANLAEQAGYVLWICRENQK